MLFANRDAPPHARADRAALLSIKEMQELICAPKLRWPTLYATLLQLQIHRASETPRHRENILNKPKIAAEKKHTGRGALSPAS
jgi:hypothetical protein